MIPADTVQLRISDRPTWLPERVWPFDTFSLTTPSDVLAITDVGSGPPLLLAHVGAWSFIWRELVTRLARDFRCITFDAPGNGRTRGAANAPITMDRAAQAVGAVIEALDLRDLTLVVHDLAGPAAIAGVAGMTRRIRGLVAMNSFAWRPDQFKLRTMLRIVGSPLMREFDVITRLVPRITSGSFGIGPELDDASRAAFRAGMDARGIRSFHAYMHDALRCDDLYARVQRALEGPLSQVPLLTIFGQRNDPFGFQKRWKELFPDAREIVVLGGNHFPMCDAPDMVAEAIREWDRQPR